MNKLPNNGNHMIDGFQPIPKTEEEQRAEDEAMDEKDEERREKKND